MCELWLLVFVDLIVMNVFYCLGFLEYILEFICWKNGEFDIVYDFDVCEEYLKEMYGIIVYQEQVMFFFQKLVGFIKGEVDVFWKVMGKKQKVVFDKMKLQFVEQGIVKGYDLQVLEKIWKDWEVFVFYVFNKFYFICYVWIVYQIVYLKVNYLVEFMVVVFSNNLNDIMQVIFFMEECCRMGILVFGLDINELEYQFIVNCEGVICFGFGGVKGFGFGLVENFIFECCENGFFQNVFDVM